MSATNDAVWTIPMFVSWAWTVLTGDLVIPSMGGAAFSLFLRATKADDQLTWKDLLAFGGMSFLFGIVVGPYFASQMPKGDGVAGVGALLMSFVGTAILQKLDRMDWDVAAFVKMCLQSLPGGKK